MTDEDHDRHARPAKRPRVLVACQRCKSRRQKCDNSSPACSNCNRANVPCIYTNHAYPPSYVKRLEERVRQLEGNLATNNGISTPSRSISNQDGLHIPREEVMAPAHLASPVSTLSQANEEVPGELRSGRLALGLGVLSSCAAAEPHYFGFSAGLSLAHFVQVAIDSGGNPAEADVSLPLLADRPFSNQAPKANTSLADPPTFKAGVSYIRAYLTSVHPLYPFLNRQRLWQLHRSITKHQGDRHAVNVEKIDLTIMHLVYAVGSRCLQLLGRRGISSAVPEGHFLSAMKNIDEDLKFTSTKSIEVTLLLAIHSMRSPYGTSVWHLSGLAIRQCLELGLHKQRIIDRQNTEVDQYRKRLFWSAYIFERKTALVLGRPFALSDEEIDLDLPANMDDTHDENTTEGAHDDSPGQQPQERTTLSFHRYHVQLYQIHTQLRLALYQMRKTASKEQLRMTISRLLDELDHWREQVLETFHETSKGPPLPPRPPTDSSEDQEAIDSEESSPGGGRKRMAVYRPVEVEKNELLLEYHKARRSLLQPLMTESRHNYTFDVADYAACAEASGQICQLYRRLHRFSPVPFTLRDLHAVFVAGFTLIYCVCTCPAIYSVERVSDVGACSTVLYVITEQWSSAKKYRDAFETIAEKMMDSAKRFHQGNSIVSTMASHQCHYDSTNQEPNSGVGSNQQMMRQHEGPQELGDFAHAASDSLEGTKDGAMSASHSIRLGAISTQASEDRPLRSLLPFSQSIPSSSSSSLNLGIGPYSDTTQFVTAGREGIGLDLDSDISDIERLISSEGIDWFTEAIL